MNSEDMRQVIHDVHLRIDQFVIGRAGRVPLAGEFRRIGGGAWWLVEVLRAQARESLVATGVRAAVEVTGQLGDRWTYSVWRRSEYIVWFPVRAILDALSAAEAAAGGTGQWGGADNVGGSPRPSGSVLSPDRVERVVEEVLARQSFQP